MEKLTEERLEEIFENDDYSLDGGDNAMQGLLIMAKYLDPFEKKTTLIQGADHDIIYGPEKHELLEAGLTEEDAIKLRNLNWGIDGEMSDGFYCFV